MINFDTYIDNFDLSFDDNLNDKEISENEESISEESSSEESKSEETLVENAKSEKVPSEDSKSEEVSDNAKSEEVPVDSAKSEEASGKSVKSDQTPAGDTIPEEVPTKNTSSQKTSNENSNNDKENLSPKFLFSNLIGKKIGMTQLFADSGDVFPATVVEAGPCTVTQIKNKKSDGYDSIQLGFSDAKEKHLTKSQLGHFLKSKLSPKKVLKEFRFDKNDNLPSIGDKVDLRQFKVGDFVTVTGSSIGKGFAGHMKRHNFGGGRASHGKNSVMRKSGSVGAGTDPGRIFPGMKMAGRMGGEKVTVKNLEIINIDLSKNLIFIKGAVPGSNKNYLYITKN